MLLDRVTGLTEKLDRYEKLKAAAGQAAMYRTRASQFEVARTSLTEVSDAIGRFEKAGIPVDFEATNADDLLQKVTSLRNLFNSDPGILNSPPFNLKYELFDRISGLSTFAQQALNRAWRSFVDAQGINGSIELLDALMKLAQFRASVIAIKACRERINQLASEAPSDVEGAKNTLETLVHQYRVAWSSISADGIPETIVEFLRASSAGGVPLSELTEEIRKWLASKSLLGAFRIRIG